MITVQNIREITKKEVGFLGLSLNAWYLSILIFASTYPIFKFKTFMLGVGIIIVFSIIEFFDQDFISIFIAKMQCGRSDEYFA